MFPTFWSRFVVFRGMFMSDQRWSTLFSDSKHNNDTKYNKAPLTKHNNAHVRDNAGQHTRERQRGTTTHTWDTTRDLLTIGRPRTGAYVCMSQTISEQLASWAGQDPARATIGIQHWLYFFLPKYLWLTGRLLNHCWNYPLYRFTILKVLYNINGVLQYYY